MLALGPISIARQVHHAVMAAQWTERTPESPKGRHGALEATIGRKRRGLFSDSPPLRQAAVDRLGRPAHRQPDRPTAGPHHLAADYRMLLRRLVRERVERAGVYLGGSIADWGQSVPLPPLAPSSALGCFADGRDDAEAQDL